MDAPIASTSQQHAPTFNDDDKGWSDDIVGQLDYTRPNLSEYLLGRVACPDPEAEPAKHMEWERDNAFVIDYLKSKCSEEERSLLAIIPYVTAEDA